LEKLKKTLKTRLYRKIKKNVYKRLLHYAFSRFDTIHACDRQTDGHGIGVAYTRYSIYSVVHNKKAQLTQGLRATAPSFQDGRQPPSWILSNRK